MSKQLSQKSFIISHLLILVLSLGLLAGLYLYVNADSNKFGWQSSGPVTTNTVSFDLTVDTPDDNVLNFDKSIVISGKSLAFSSIVISGPDEDQALTTNSSGDFSQVVNLTPGVNVLQVTAYDDNGDSKTVDRTIYYSEDQLP